MLESWQQKRPVVTSNIPPMSEIIQNNNTGILIDPNDDEKWANVIIQLITNPNLSDSLGEAGYQEMKTKYNEKLFYEQIIKMYESIL